MALELAGVIDDYKVGTYEKKAMDAEQFFFEMSKTPPYHYFAGNADQLGEAYNDLFPVDPFIVKNDSWTPETSHLFRWTNVWIGPAGATTHTHYDISENFYVQIYGKKRYFFVSIDHRIQDLYYFLPKTTHISIYSHFSTPEHNKAKFVLTIWTWIDFQISNTHQL